MQLFSRAVPIWSISKGEISDQYRLFRKKFTVDNISEPVFLDIAADSTYCVMVNQKRLPIQQLADFKGDITVSRYDITSLLNNGENIIACEVHFIGADFFTCFAGTACLCAEIHSGKQIYAATDETWKCTVSPDMQSGLNCKVSLQLGFIFCKDARKSIAWEKFDFDDSAWQNAVKVENCGNWQMNLRRVPQLVELPRLQMQCVPQFGYIKRAKEESTFALTAFRDYLSPRRAEDFFDMAPVNRVWHNDGEDLILKPLSDDADGYYIIIDTGCERVGFATLDITAPAGTVIDICHGEHLEDGRVRSYVGERNFADRLITSEGRNQLLYSHRRLGLRYMELHITNCQKGNITLHYAGIIPLELPLPERSQFSCGDHLIQKLNELSYDTLKLCMHEHYEDCPWREQSLYAYDSRNQMLYGYYVWGNYEFARASLDLLGKSFDGKDYIELIAPGEAGLTIPVFTMVWISALYEHHLFSGNDELTRKYIKVVDTILDSAFSRTMEDAPNLYHTGSGKRIWNFCEWNGILSRLDEHPQSTYNTYLCEASRSAAKLHAMLGNTEREKYLTQRADAIAAAVEKRFYNAEKGFYNAGGKTADDGYEHVQQIMLANDIVPAEKISALLDNIFAGKLNSIDLSAFCYLISGMMKSGPDARKHLVKTLLDSLSLMLFSGATSLWESNDNFDKFRGAASLCHAWSSVMPYFCAHCILGVTPLEAGFKKFEVKPYPAGLHEASGSIPTPYGFIKVSWKSTDSGMIVSVEHPENLECVTASYPECGNVKFEIIRAAVSSCAQELKYPTEPKQPHLPTQQTCRAIYA